MRHEPSMGRQGANPKMPTYVGHLAFERKVRELSFEQAFREEMAEGRIVLGEGIPNDEKGERKV